MTGIELTVVIISGVIILGLVITFGALAISYKRIVAERSARLAEYKKRDAEMAACYRADMADIERLYSL